RPAVSPTRQHHLSSAGEGGSKYYQQKPQAENYINLQNSAKLKVSVFYQTITPQKIIHQP
ncbi:hypothetical protein, partial [Ruegeria lacuscaerulensis]|uniref:hypothetical protein n=1 Tax=Ruegeria lacuscaerulensis TaxID=55218 RepID=UPI001BE4C971